MNVKNKYNLIIKDEYEQWPKRIVDDFDFYILQY